MKRGRKREEEERGREGGRKEVEEVGGGKGKRVGWGSGKALEEVGAMISDGADSKFFKS